MRAVSAAEDGHHRAAAEQQQASSCPVPSSSAAALQATVEQLLLEVENLRRDMQELKAAAARPAPGTIVDSTNLKCGWGWPPAPVPKALKKYILVLTRVIHFSYRFLHFFLLARKIFIPIFAWRNSKQNERKVRAALFIQHSTAFDSSSSTLHRPHTIPRQL